MPDTIITELPDRNMTMRGAVLWAQAYADSDSAQMLKTHSGALDIWKMSIDAGERYEDSTTGADHLATAGEWAMSAAIDLSVDASTTVWPGPALLGGIWVSVAPGTAAASIDDNATARVPIPIALPIGEHPVGPIIFNTSLVVNPADATTGTICVWFRPLDPSVVWNT